MDAGRSGQLGARHGQASVLPGCRDTGRPVELGHVTQGGPCALCVLQVTAVSAPLLVMLPTTRCAWISASVKMASVCPSASGSRGWSPARVMVSTWPCPSLQRGEGRSSGWCAQMDRCLRVPLLPRSSPEAVLSISLVAVFSDSEATRRRGQRGLRKGGWLEVCPHSSSRWPRALVRPRTHPVRPRPGSPLCRDVCWASRRRSLPDAWGRGLSATASGTLVLRFPHCFWNPWV